VLVPKNGNVSDLIAGLIKKANLEDEATKGPIRIYETYNSKVYKELPRDYGVVGITDYINIVAERMPEEDVDAEPGHFINAFHFQGEPNRPHNIPFRFLLKQVSIVFACISSTGYLRVLG
jgi:ubiquitin carboxyl-terminal hydrolase 7